MDDPRAEDWMPPPGLLAKNERDELNETEQRTLGRRRLKFYELYCGNCGTLYVLHNDELLDGQVWLCSDCETKT